MTTRALVSRAFLTICLLGSACVPAGQHEAGRTVPPALCADLAAPERTARTLGTPGLLAVSPDVEEHVMPKGRNQRRLRGAVLRYAAPAGVTDAWFQRQLICHQVDVAQGTTDASLDDPFIVSRGWLSYAVELSGPELVVSVHAVDENTAGEVVDRAHRYQERTIGR